MFHYETKIKTSFLSAMCILMFYTSTLNIFTIRQMITMSFSSTGMITISLSGT